jgi:transcriptional regulator GlxA family with amidase domain
MMYLVSKSIGRTDDAIARTISPWMPLILVPYELGSNDKYTPISANLSMLCHQPMLYSLYRLLYGTTEPEGNPLDTKSSSLMSRDTPDTDVRLVVLLAVPPALELDIVGPQSVFEAANSMPERSAPATRIELVTTGAERTIEGQFGISLVAHRHYSEINEPIDTLLVVGGDGARIPIDEEVLVWLRDTATRVRRLGSVCTGAFLLAAAGLLNGRRATTHWMYAQELADRYPKVTVDPNPVWVQDGNVYTSAGVTAGMDLALAMVEEDHGTELALQVARSLVLFLRRPGGQAQFSVSLSGQATERKSLLELQVWMAENLNGDLSVESLAARSAMSPRNFARVFVREVGITPARYVSKLRLEAARRQLERTEKNLEAIAAGCGFGSAEIMRRAFLRSFNITPVRYRECHGIRAISCSTVK